MLELGAVAEHGDRHGQPPRLGGKPRQPQRHRARHRLRPDLAHPPGVLGRRREALAVDRVEDRPQEQRVAAGGRVARDDERLLGLDLELVPGQRGDRGDAQRGRPDHQRRGIGDQLGQQFFLDALLGWAQAEDDEQRQPLEPACEVGEPAQRGRVRPVQVVDHDCRRTARGQVRGEPVEPVQDGEGDVTRGGAGQLLVAEEPVGQPGGASHQLLSLVERKRGQVGLEELAHDAVGELLLEIRAARHEHLEACLGGERPRLGHEPGLAHPGAALDRDHPPGSRVRRVHHGVHGGELGLALEQRNARDLNFGPPAGRAWPGLRQLAHGQRRELVLQARAGQLVEALGTVEVGQRDLPQIDQLELPRQVVAHEAGRRVRDQHLAAVPRVADARRLVHRVADVPVAAHVRLAGVKAHTHAQGDSLRPLVRGQDGLGGSGGRDPRARAAKDDEEGIALGFDLDPARVGKGLAQQFVVHRENLAVAVAAEALEQPRRALDIGEQEGHRARGQAS